MTRVRLYPGPIDTFAIRRYTDELATGLANLGVNVSIDRSRSDRRTVIRYLADILRVRKHENDLNIVCSEGLAYLLLGLPAEKTLVVCHDVHPLLEKRMLPRSQTGTVRKRFFRLKYRASLWVLRANETTHIVAISKHTASHLAEEARIPSERISVIHNGLARNWGESPSGHTERVSTLPDHRKVVLHVGNDNWYKNFGGCVEAVALLDRSDVILVKAGQLSEDSRKLIAQRHLGDRFVFLPDPTDDELRALYRRASVLSFPSRHEGFGWPPLEAMAAGCPVVVANAGSLPEVCRDAALYVTPSDPRSIAEGLSTVLDDDQERARLIERGLERVKDFSWENSAAAFLEHAQATS